MDTEMTDKMREEGEKVESGVPFEANLEGLAKWNVMTPEIIERNRKMEAVIGYCRNSNSSVTDILSSSENGGYGLVSEVERFYDVRRTWDLDGEIEKPGKKDCSPAALINLLDNFGEKPLNRKKLSYNQVRKDLKSMHLHYKCQPYLRAAGLPVGLALIGASLPIAEFSVLAGVAYYVLGARLSMEGVIRSLGDFVYNISSKEYDENLGKIEVGRLLEKAKIADCFAQRNREAIVSRMKMKNYGGSK